MVYIYIILSSQYLSLTNEITLTRTIFYSLKFMCIVFFINWYVLYFYRDPITEFIEHLYVNFDFDGARQKLHECQTVLLSDFFLIACIDEFVENARLMIFETFCRIHQCISIG